MKAEKYLLEYVREHNMSSRGIEVDTGINLERIVMEEQELMADEFLRLCAYLNITPEEISDQIL